jgi:hypothetical protein
MSRRDLLRRLPPGWRASLTRGGHIRLSKPGRRAVFTASTPGDWRSWRNALAAVRREERRG